MKNGRYRIYDTVLKYMLSPLVTPCMCEITFLHCSTFKLNSILDAGSNNRNQFFLHFHCYVNSCYNIHLNNTSQLHTK
jgi:hypothetical protein